MFWSKTALIRRTVVEFDTVRTAKVEGRVRKSTPKHDTVLNTSGHQHVMKTWTFVV
jgi:hypothetical protein